MSPTQDKGQWLRRRCSVPALPSSPPLTSMTSSTSTMVPSDVPLSILKEPFQPAPHDKDVADDAHVVLGQCGAVIIKRKYRALESIGMEKARRFVISTTDKRKLGYVVEEPEKGLGKAMLRQFLGAHRPFKATLQDLEGNVLLHMARPYTWFHSEIHVLNTQGNPVGHIQRRFHAWKRRYNLYLGKQLVATVREGILAWDFTVVSWKGQVMGHISRRFRGALREAFTDTGKYIMDMESIQDINSSQPHPMNISERSIMLAMVICIDFDFFSPLSNPYG